MAAEETRIRERIVLATVECVEKYGLQSVTIRTIARTAGVNSAAINYYFRSKENLLGEVLRSTAEHSIGDLRDIVRDESLRPRALLHSFFLYMMDGAVRFPNLTKAHIYDTLMHGRYDVLFIRRFNELLAELADRIKPAFPDDDVGSLRMRLAQAMSSVILPALMPRMYWPFAKLNFEDDRTRAAYVDALVDGLFKI